MKRFLKARCRRRSQSGIPGLQALESRTLLSASPVNAEVRVNASITGDQINPAAAMDPGGDYVVVWQSLQSGVDWDIYMQRYSAWGNPLITEIRTNTTTVGSQTNPAVAMDSLGDLVVVWESPDGSSDGIFAQRFDSSGAAIGNQFQINTTLSNSQTLPSVAMDAGGNFVVAWTSNTQDGSGTGIYAQSYNADGTRRGGEFRVNGTATNDQSSPSIAIDGHGNFVVSWYSSQTAGQPQIYARRFNSANAPLGSEFLVSNQAGLTSLDVGSKVAMNSQGQFLITWDCSASDDPLSTGIFAQRYDSLGTPLGSVFRVNSTIAGSQLLATPAIDSQGGFIVTWASTAQDYTDGELGVYAQRFSSTGDPLGSEFRVNSYVIGKQTNPTVAVDAAGDFIVAWTSAAQDTSGYGIYSQLYANKSDFVGVKRAASFYLDSNHSDNYDSFGTSNDLVTSLGNSGDLPVVGDWNGDGFDDIGVWRAGIFYLDANGNGKWDGTTLDRFASFGLSTDTPIVGDWNGDGIDDIGVWRAGVFYLDTNGNRSLDAGDASFAFGAASDTPLVGDWNGDGKDEVGVWRAGRFFLDLNGNRKWDRPDVDAVFSFGNPTDTPLVGDWNGDGTDKVGVWRAGQFWTDFDGSRKWDAADYPYIIDFGNPSGDVPLVGFWRPKAVPGTPPAAPASAVITAPLAEQISAPAPTITASQLDNRTTQPQVATSTTLQTSAANKHGDKHLTHSPRSSRKVL